MQLNQLPILLAKAVGAGATYDFQSIPAQWTHLLIVGAFQTGSTNAFDSVVVRFNNDSAANYYWEELRASGATVTGGEGLAATSIGIGRAPGVATAGFATTMTLISRYGVAQLHQVVSPGFAASATTTGNQQIEIFGGWWNSPSIINRVTILPAAGSFVAGSGAWLYGLGTI